MIYYLNVVLEMIVQLWKQIYMIIVNYTLTDLYVSQIFNQNYFELVGA